MSIRVAFDARDARRADRRGWGRYAAELLHALGRRDDVAVTGHTGGSRLPELAWEQVGWPARLRADPPDVLHAPNCFLPLARPCAGVVTVHDLAFEVHPHDFAARTGWKYRTFTRRAVASAQAVICVSHATRDDVLERYAVDPARVHVVPNAPSLAGPPVAGTPGSAGTPRSSTDSPRSSVDSPRSSVGGPRSADPPPSAGTPGDDRPYLLAIGDLRAKKNLRRLADAWERSGLPHRLVVAGAAAGGPDGARIAGDLRARGVELPGYLPDAELDALLRGADALVHPSLFEGFGLVVLEAMARGVPVACSAIPSLRETAGGAAALFDPRDTDDVAGALHDVLARRAALAAAGRARAAEFTWDRSAAETAAVYRLVVS